MPAKSKTSRFCEKCGRTKTEDNFYTSNNLEKYPTGRLNQCRDCITMHINNWEPETFLWVLEECDVPYIPKEWDKLLASYAKDPSETTGKTIIGRYLAKMKLKQFKKWRWKDTAYLQELANKETAEAMEMQGYDTAEIDKAIREHSLQLSEDGTFIAPPPPPVKDFEDIDNFDSSATEEDDSIVGALTDEDKLYLRMKWGKSYKPEEWVWLENLFNEMMDSYDIQTAGHIDTLKLVCKTSLKSNQLLDMGDVEGANKMIKTYDTLMKSGKFTASQNKGENGEAVDSLGELFALCEKDGFIPRYYTDGPQDKVDRTLQDLQSYTRSLITEEMNLGTLIEQAVKQIQTDKEKEATIDADTADDEENFENELFGENQSFLEDDDFSELKQMIEDNEMDDNEFLASLIDDEDLI